MLIIWLAREGEARQDLVQILRVVNDQVIPLRLAREKPVHSLGIEPFLAQRFALHPVEAGVELCLQLVPFRAVGVLGTPGETIKLVDVKMRETRSRAACS